MVTGTYGGRGRKDRQLWSFLGEGRGGTLLASVSARIQPMRVEVEHQNRQNCPSGANILVGGNRQNKTRTHQMVIHSKGGEA